MTIVVAMFSASLLFAISIQINLKTSIKTKLTVFNNRVDSNVLNKLTATLVSVSATGSKSFVAIY